MKINPIYAYLSHLSQEMPSMIPLEKKQSKNGSDYFFIQLPLPAQAHSASWTITENHLTCFATLEPDSYFSDIHYTAMLQQEYQEIKIHVYLDRYGEIVGFYAKNMANPEKKVAITLTDILPCFLTASPILEMIRQAAYKMHLSIKLDYQRSVRELDEQFFTGCITEIKYQAALERIILLLKKLMSFDASYERQYKRFNQTLASLSTTQTSPIVVLADVEEVADLEIDVTVVGRIEHQPTEREPDAGIGVVQGIRDNMLILQAILSQNISKTKHADKIITIDTRYQAKMYDALAIYDQINADLIIMDELKIPNKQQHLLRQLQLQFELISAQITQFANEYFRTMVVCKALEEYPLLASYIDKPEAPLIKQLIKGQAIEVLKDVLKRHHFSLVEPLFSGEHKTILELIIHNKDYHVFAALMDAFSIDFLQQHPDGRPLACLILALNPQNRIQQKCMLGHPQFKSESFYSQVKGTIEPLLLAHPQRQELLMIYQLIDILKKRAGLSMGSYRVNEAAMGRHREFFDSLSSQVEHMTFLRAPHFAGLLREYVQLVSDQVKDARAHHQRRVTHHANYDSPEMRQIIEQTLAGLDENTAFLVMHITLEISKLNAHIAKIDNELSTKACSKKSLRTDLLLEKAQLKEKIAALQRIEIVREPRFELRCSESSLAAKSIFASQTPEKPLAFYAALPGINAQNIDLMRQIRVNTLACSSEFQFEYTSAIKQLLTQLERMLTEQVIPAETKKAIDSFLMHEAKKICQPFLLKP